MWVESDGIYGMVKQWMSSGRANAGCVMIECIFAFWGKGIGQGGELFSWWGGWWLCEYGLLGSEPSFGWIRSLDVDFDIELVRQGQGNTRLSAMLCYFKVR
jgi:hypothetical protein